MHAYAIALMAVSATGILAQEINSVDGTTPAVSNPTGTDSVPAVTDSVPAVTDSVPIPDATPDADAEQATDEQTDAPTADAAATTMANPASKPVITVDKTTLLTITSCAPGVTNCPATIKTIKNNGKHAKHVKTVTITAPCSADKPVTPPTETAVETTTERVCPGPGCNTTTPTGMPVVAGASSQPVQVAALIGGLSLAIAIFL